MSNVYVTSDWHLGHKGIASTFRKRFTDDYHHDMQIVEEARYMLNKRDLVYFLGDVAFTTEGLEAIGTLPGRKILIRGNHDTLPMAQYNAVFEAIHGALRYKGAFLTHIPIHPMELFRGFNIHGHCHRGGPREMKKGDDWHQYYNAILEFNDYRLIKMEHVFDVLKRGATNLGEG